MLIKRIKKSFDFKSIQKDLRQLWVNFITAGVGGLFVAHITELTFGIFTASACVIIAGAACIVSGVYRRKANESK